MYIVDRRCSSVSVQPVVCRLDWRTLSAGQPAPISEVIGRPGPQEATVTAGIPVSFTRAMYGKGHFVGAATTWGQWR